MCEDFDSLMQPNSSLSAFGLSQLARREILSMTSRAKASHVGSALSVVDILSVLYLDVADITPQNLTSQDRDIVILSKGHAAAALYAVLGLLGFFPTALLNSYCENNAILGGHVTSKGVPGVELSTGSLGHGLPYGAGIALAKKRAKVGGRVFVIMSDGECDEGTTWESAMIANHFNLDNLTVIIDRNRIQSLTFTESTLKLEPFGEKWSAFGWEVKSVDGHDFDSLRDSLSTKVGPLCIIAQTIKGKGVSFMENEILWHYKSPNSDELQIALNEVGRLQN
jgi:transketolase